jgi:LmbE family N-acetylglucosaminyl deacetylase
MNIMIIAAHPDDEVLGCGATAARLVKEGHKVTPIILCENASVRYDSGMRNNLEEWCRQSSKILGMSEPVFLRYADQKLDTYPSLEMAQVIEKMISDLQPEVIFTHHGGDINRDHQVLFEAALVAARPVPGCPVKTVYSYETISSTEWAATEYYSTFRPNVFFDASETIEMKLKAFGCYVSEIKPYPHPRSIEAIEIRMKDWGSRVGLKAAEAFQLVRALH